MPAVSIKQRRAMAIAEHHPEQLYKRNRGLLKMSKAQLHDFAATKEKKLPVMANPPDRRKRKRGFLKAKQGMWGT